jgi:hypothetical protein
MTSVIDRMMAAADLPAVPEIQAVCYTEVTPESKASFQQSSVLNAGPGDHHPARSGRPGICSQQRIAYRTKVRYLQYRTMVIVPRLQGNCFMKTQRKRALAVTTEGGP